MSYTAKIMELVNDINRKFDEEKVSARFHMTRHDIKVEVFNNKKNFTENKVIVERIRYFNDDKSEEKLRQLHLKLHAFLDGHYESN